MEIENGGERPGFVAFARGLPSRVPLAGSGPAPPPERFFSPTSPPLPTVALPVPATPFVGRSEELAQIASKLANPDCRLFTLVGPGGMGKTRLALANKSLVIAAGRERYDLHELTRLYAAEKLRADEAADEQIRASLATYGDMRRQTQQADAAFSGPAETLVPDLVDCLFIGGLAAALAQQYERSTVLFAGASRLQAQINHQPDPPLREKIEKAARALPTHRPASRNQAAVAAPYEVYAPVPAGTE